MLNYLTKTSIGYSHIKEHKYCQDFSAAYHDEERTIITACDGHGGDMYVRSHLGSKFASNAVINVLKELDKSDFYKFSKEDICNNIKLRILCEWNSMVEEDLNKKSLSRKEVIHLSDERLFKLLKNKEKAYGTTLNAAMVFGNKLICISIGDGGIFLLKRGQIIPAVEDDEEAVANFTYSMSQDDAYSHLKVKIYDFSSLNGVIVCTDGLINPYQSIGNFQESFVKPICKKIKEGKLIEVDDYIKIMGEEIGIGDDVSFGIILKV